MSAAYWHLGLAIEGLCGGFLAAVDRTHQQHSWQSWRACIALIIIMIIIIRRACIALAA